jgi:hypothetical protein
MLPGWGKLWTALHIAKRMRQSLLRKDGIAASTFFRGNLTADR